MSTHPLASFEHAQHLLTFISVNHGGLLGPDATTCLSIKVPTLVIGAGLIRRSIRALESRVEKPRPPRPRNGLGFMMPQRIHTVFSKRHIWSINGVRTRLRRGVPSPMPYEALKRLRRCPPGSGGCLVSFGV
jgi:hypothetical protein